jgi:secreted trypsin-like serine protease
VTVKVWQQQSCVSKHGSMIKTGMICFGEQGAAVCSGDSGGPLNCFVNGKWYSYGAHSFTVDRCEGPNNVSVAARNSEYSDWVWSTIAAN